MLSDQACQQKSPQFIDLIYFRLTAPEWHEMILRL